MQSHAVDKRLRVEDLKYELVDVIVGAVLTGVIGLFVIVACAATLHARGIEVNDAGAAAAAALEPLSTAYSISETFGRKADLDDSFGEARLSYLSFGAVVALAAGLVLIPGVPLVKVLFLSQALKAVPLLVLLPFVRRLGRDPELMGKRALGPRGRRATAAALAPIVVSVAALGVLAVA